MKTKSLFSLALLLVTATLLAAAPPEKKGAAKKGPAGKSAAADADSLDRFKALAGEWTGKGMHGEEEHEMTVVYKVTSGGSAVVETIGPGSEHEMITVFHADGDDLALTHYCMLGNQPHMKASPKAGDDSFAFEFVSASNLKSEKDMHMHSVTYTFVDENTLKSEWTHYDDGQETGKAAFELTRREPSKTAGTK